MKKFRVYGDVRGTTFVGIFEAETEAEAHELASPEVDISLCHHCARKIDCTDIFELIIEEVEDE